jgi:hypothetical protein
MGVHDPNQDENFRLAPAFYDLFIFCKKTHGMGLGEVLPYLAPGAIIVSLDRETEPPKNLEAMQSFPAPFFGYRVL